MKEIKLFNGSLFDNQTAEEIIKILNKGIVSTSSEIINEMGNILEEYYKRKVILLNSGTSALHISSLVSPKGDVLMPAFAFVAAVNAFLYDNRTIRLYDLDHNLQPDWDIVKKIIKENNVSVFVLVHQFGVPVDVPQDIVGFLKERNIMIIEDGSESICSVVNNKKIGTIGDISILSFNGNKTITAGGGGAFLTNDKDLYERAKSLSVPSNAKEGKGYKHLTYNYGMTGLHAALLKDQWDKKDIIVDRKKKIRDHYKRYITQIPVVKNSDIIYWLYPIYVEDTLKFQKIFTENEIQTQPFFPVLSHIKYVKADDKYVKNAYELENKGLLLPSHIGITDKDIEYIIKIYKNVK